MSNYTEQQLEDKLKILASIEPSVVSRQRMNNRIRQVIAGSETHQPITRSFFYYAVTSAAMLLIGIGLLRQTGSIEKPYQIAHPTQTDTDPTLANLNAVFNDGGQKAMEQYLDTIEQHRQPRAETITLQEIMKEL